MWITDEIEYCRAREREEREAAQSSNNTAIHDAHFVMAERYADRVYSLLERADRALRAARLSNRLRIIS